jgi:WD40-like Beta Propeller Repeat
MKKFLVAGCLLLFVGLLVSCGLKTETSFYYFRPAWVRDGKVIFIGARQTVDKDTLGSQIGSSYSEYAQTIYPTGTGESTALFDVTEDPAYAMSCSPTTDYVAYMGDLRSGLYGKITIRNIASGQHSGLELIELTFSPGIKAFDWSNDGTKLVYCTTGEIRTVDVDGSNDILVLAVANLEFVAWQYGGRIAFVTTSGSDKLLSLVYSDGTGRLDLAAASSVDEPQISAANTNEVFGVVSDAYAKVNVNTTTRTNIVASGFTGSLPRLSPDAATVTYSKVGETTGVYTMTVSNGAESQLK